MFRYKLIKNKEIDRENFFNKNELGEILNLYGKMVSKGEWKDYAFYINKIIESICGDCNNLYLIHMSDSNTNNEFETE